MGGGERERERERESSSDYQTEIVGVVFLITCTLMAVQVNVELDTLPIIANSLNKGPRSLSFIEGVSFSLRE
jgi:hypothetical protein